MKNKLENLGIALIILLLLLFFFDGIEAMNKVPEPCSIETLTVHDAPNGKVIRDCHGNETFYKNAITREVGYPE